MTNPFYRSSKQGSADPEARLVCFPPKALWRAITGWLVFGWLLGSVHTGSAKSTPIPKAHGSVAASTILLISITRPLTLCQGSVTQIQAVVPPGFTPNWYWTKDGQRFGGDRETSVTLRESGTYTLGGEWENDPSVAVNGRFDLTMIEQPVTTITASAVTVCAGTSFTLAANPSTPANQYQWVDSRHRFVMAGAVLAINSPDAYSLVVVSPSSCTYVGTAPLVTAFASQSVTVQAEGPLAFCEGNSVRLVQGGGELTNPVWLRNGQPLTDPYSATLTVSDDGEYSLQSDGAACLYYPPPVSVTVGARPSVQLLASRTVVCQGDSYELSLRPIDPASQYRWIDPAGRVVNSEAVGRISVAAEGAYTVQITTPLGCSLVLTSEGLVQFRPLTDIAIRPLGPTPLCAGNSTTLTAAVGDVSGYYWTRDGVALTGTANAPVLTASQSGTYAVAGPFPVCTQVRTPAVVRVEPLPIVRIAAASLTLCAGQSTTLTAETDAATSFRWQRNGAEAGAASSLLVNEAATFALTVTSPAGCQQTATYAFSPTRYELPVFSLSAPEAVFPNTLVPLTDVPERSDYQYRWTPAAGASDPTIARPLLNPAVATSYTLTITDGHGCSYSNGLRLNLLANLLAPSAFTPNGDGQNDTWVPINLDRYPTARLCVYDRWGELVYSGGPDDAPFDGTRRGEPLPGGVYTYRIHLTVPVLDARGTLLLLR